MVWWSQLVTSPLWAQELSFERPLEIASISTGREQASFLRKSFSGFCSLLLAMPTQLYSQPFGMLLWDRLNAEAWRLVSGFLGVNRLIT
jgi:hypothetical protein